MPTVLSLYFSAPAIRAARLTLAIQPQDRSPCAKAERYFAPRASLSLVITRPRSQARRVIQEARPRYSSVSASWGSIIETFAARVAGNVTLCQFWNWCFTAGREGLHERRETHFAWLTSPLRGDALVKLTDLWNVVLSFERCNGVFCVWSRHSFVKIEVAVIEDKIRDWCQDTWIRIEEVMSPITWNDRYVRMVKKEGIV